jgi:UDP-N-acetylglucosamine acyltransferase
MATDIHTTAIVEDGALIGEGVSVGPFSIIGKEVRIGDDTEIGSHVTVAGRTEIGSRCKVFPYASIGTDPQDLKYDGEDTGARIGDESILREYVTVNRGSVGGDGMTEVGSNCFLMAYSHVAHDCRVGKHVVMANAATLGGHVSIGDRAFLGGFVAVHQNCRIGTYVMIGGVGRMTKDVPPYVMAVGVDNVKLFGLNSVGLKRGGVSEDAIKDLKAAYKIIFGKKGSLKEAMKKVQEDLPYTDEIAHLIEFLTQCKRGFYR